MKPLIVYDSMTGNVKRFVSKLEYENLQITSDLEVDQPYILITYTIGHGNVPESTKEFLNRNSLFLSGVAASGNMNWGAYYGRAGKIISVKYNVPLIHIFELGGNNSDVILFKKGVEKICQDLKSRNGFNITMK